jgi:tRNA threonylcarbamoyl adenosine modification protein (Sua5/YciO/YrdC/YwlC family)
MAAIYTIHPETPQVRSIEQIKDALRGGAVMLYPTDTVYAIGCDMQSKSAIARVRQIKQLSNQKPLTFMCPSLSNVAAYAWVSDEAYRIMKRLIPGPYTFLLPATKLVPQVVMNPKRKTTGIRVPDYPVCQALLQALDNPIISTSAHLLDEEKMIPRMETNGFFSKAVLFDQMENLVDIIVDDGSEPTLEVSTILDLTGEEPIVVRQGLGYEAIAAMSY